MKGIKFYAALLGLSLFAISLSAQTSEYKVFYFSGSPKIVDKKVETNLVRDSYISSKSSLKVPAGSYVVLTNKNDVPMGINTPGTYSVPDLNKIYEDVGNSNLTQEFFNYIANNMIQNSQKERKSGGVYRAVGDIIRDPFDDAMVIENYVVLNWANPKQKKLYLKIYDEESGEPVIDNYATTDSAFVVKFDEKIYQKGKKYSWIVSPTSSDPDQGTILRTFTFADDEWKKEYQKEVDEINKTENEYMRKIKLIRLSLEKNIYPILEMY
ncbi:MAG: hypothetical protein II815_02900 [Bacteroidales bacterium]|nr:hypothetical protein [Bacteroidales bacterium]